MNRSTPAEGPAPYGEGIATFMAERAVRTAMVEAMHVTTESAGAVAEWVGGRAFHARRIPDTGHRAFVVLDDDRVACEGDWAVRSPSGKLTVMGPIAFGAAFRRCRILEP